MKTGDKIKYLREQRGYTLEQLGKRVGVGKSTVRKWETGAIENMGRDKIAKLAEVFGVSPTYLITDDEPSKLSPKVFFKDLQYFGDKKEPTVLSTGELDPELIELFKMISQLSDDQRKMIIAQVRGILQYLKSQDAQ